MLSFAIVSLSPCSAAISSRTGATILHGPHHSAQKSTSTGLSLPSTSSAKLASVTVLVLLAMGRSPQSFVARNWALQGQPARCLVYAQMRRPACGVGQGAPFRGPGSALVELLGQVALG